MRARRSSRTPIEPFGAAARPDPRLPRSSIEWRARAEAMRRIAEGPGSEFATHPSTCLCEVCLRDGLEWSQDQWEDYYQRIFRREDARRRRMRALAAVVTIVTLGAGAILLRP